ncbi:MAG: hypothetical protein GY793_10095, partial [Proteobacteria bacterium]|nr:hypothetical protein [Pseudomonadota bacterium]
MPKLSLRNPFFYREAKKQINKYNDALFSWLGNSYASYDTDGTSYVDNGYNINPIVYSVVNQRAKKVSSVPFNIKKVKDVAQKKLRDNLIKSTNYDLTPQQEVKRLIYESKAFDD